MRRPTEATLKLNHLDLRVRDVSAFSAFLVRHFDFVITSHAESKALVFLHDGHGFSLVLQRSAQDVTYPEDFHLGFLVEHPEEVHRVRARLSEAGLEVPEVVVNGRGTLLYLRGPEGLLFEVSARSR